MTVSAGSSQWADLGSGDVLADRYELLEPLAVGGMGTVWNARNLVTGAEVAAKVLLPAHAGSPEGVARFRREAQATAALSHRAIVRVFDLVELDPERGSLVMIMEKLRGHTLAREIEEKGRLSVRDTIEIVLPLLSALSHAHGIGIVHRDLKPENVFLAFEPDGQRMPKIVDFGISKLLWQHPITQKGRIVGTLGYMSPEQTMGVGVDTRTDIFSVGVLLYECLSGRNPFHNPFMGSTLPADLMSLFDIEARRLEQIPPALWQVIQRALAKNATDRFDSAADLASAIRSAVPGELPAPEGRALSVPPLTSAAHGGAREPFRWSYWVLTGAVLATLALITVASVASPTTRPAKGQGELARQSRFLPHDKHLVADADVRLAPGVPSVEVEGEPGVPAPLRAARPAVTRRAAPAVAEAAPRPIASERADAAPKRGGGVLRDPGF